MAPSAADLHGALLLMQADLKQLRIEVEGLKKKASATCKELDQTDCEDEDRKEAGGRDDDLSALKNEVAALKKDLSEWKMSMHEGRKVEPAVSEVLDQVREWRIHDLLRSVDRREDDDVWTRLLQTEVNSAKSGFISGFGGRPFFTELVNMALKNGADADACNASGQSLLCQVLDHHFTADNMSSTAIAARALVDAGASLGEDEVRGLAGAWGLAAGQEYHFQAIIEHLPRDSPARGLWFELRLQNCSEEERDCTTEEERIGKRPFHLRGLTIRQIREVYDDHRRWIEELEYNPHAERETARTMHDVVEAIIKPRTAWRGCSYAELMPSGKIHVFVSHDRGNEFPDFVRAIEAYAKATSQILSVNRPEDVRCWVCSFVVCQHSVELGSCLGDSPFVKALEHCERIVCTIDGEASLFTRAWCVYELFYGIEQRKIIDFASPDGILARTTKMSKYQAAAIEALAQFDPEKAEASNQKDKDMIFGAIRASEGGLKAVKDKVQSMLSTLYSLGEMDKDLRDPITGKTIPIESGTVPLSIHSNGKDMSARHLLEQGWEETGRRILLVAELGSGKTVLAKQLVMSAVRSDAMKSVLVAWVPVGDLRAIADGGGDLLVGWVEGRTGRESMDAQVFRSPAAKGFEKTLLILDGLDDAQDKIVEILQWLLRWLEGGSRSIILTSRPSALPQGSDADTLLREGSFQRVEMAELSFQDATMLATNRLRLQGNSAMEQVAKGLQVLEHSDLLRRPLLCTMLAHALQARLQDAPEEDPTQNLKECDVYMEALRSMFGGVSCEARSAWCDMIVNNHAANTRDITLRDLPIEISSQVKVGQLPLLDRDHTDFQVFHSSVQEFLCAIAVRAGTQKLTQDHRGERTRKLLQHMIPHEVWSNVDGTYRTSLQLRCACKNNRSSNDSTIGIVSSSLRLALRRGVVEVSGSGTITLSLERALSLKIQGTVRGDAWDLAIILDLDGAIHQIPLVGQAECFESFAKLAFDSQLAYQEVHFSPVAHKESLPSTSGPLSTAVSMCRQLFGISPEPQGVQHARGSELEAIRTIIALAASVPQSPGAQVSPSLVVLEKEIVSRLSTLLAGGDLTQEMLQVLAPALPGSTLANVLAAEAFQELSFVNGAGAAHAKYMGIAQGLDGRMYCAPSNINQVLVIDPNNLELSFIDGAGEGGWKYRGIAPGPDGRMYCAPLCSHRVLVIDTKTQELSFINGVGLGSDGHSGIAQGPDGRMYCAPYRSGRVLVIDTKTQELSFIQCPRSGAAAWRGIALGPDGRMYCAPCDGDEVLVIDPATQELSFIGGAGSGDGMYEDIAQGPDGLMYCAPRNSDRVLVIDPKTKELSFIDIAGKCQAEYFGIVQGPDGYMYCAPINCNRVLVIHPKTRSVSFIEGPTGHGELYHGFARGPGGRMFSAPYRSDQVMSLSFSRSLGAQITSLIRSIRQHAPGDV